MMKAYAKILLPLILGALVLALLLTIIGSSTNHDAILGAGIVGWFAFSSALFAWAVISVWTRAKRYGK